MQLERLKSENRNWAQQFSQAMNVNAGNLENPNVGNACAHVLAFPWKIVSALIPPPIYCNGWLAFFASLLVVGLLILLMLDFAAMFGCLSGLDDLITVEIQKFAPIFLFFRSDFQNFVLILRESNEQMFSDPKRSFNRQKVYGLCSGCSYFIWKVGFLLLNFYRTALILLAIAINIPDIFAAKSASLQEMNADCAIGFLPGTIAANALFGLGLPWFVGASFQNSKGERFLVFSFENLGFVLVLLTVTFLLTGGLLLARRNFRLFTFGELGGSSLPKFVSALILLFLWCIFVIFSVLQVYEMLVAFSY